MAVGRCRVLVERDDELTALSRLAGEAAAGPVIVAVTGESGTGKSRLAQELGDSLPEPWTVARFRLALPGAPLPEPPAARPVLAVLDDAHFLDPVALERLPGWLPGLVVLTFRLDFPPAGSARMRALPPPARAPAVPPPRPGRDARSPPPGPRPGGPRAAARAALPGRDRPDGGGHGRLRAAGPA